MNLPINSNNDGNKFLDRLELILSGQNQKVLNKLGEVSNRLDVIESDHGELKKDVHFLKKERPVERREAGKLKRAIGRRVCELLEVPYDKKQRTLEDQIKYNKYSGKLFGRCYTEIPNDGHLAISSYLDTPIGEFDAAMRDIESFTPHCGMLEFYKQADRDALANKIKKEQGY